MPEALKYLLGKLQIPILRASLKDKSFFVDRQHPARQFIDALSNEKTLFSPLYHQKVETIVQGLLAEDDLSQESFLRAFNACQEVLVTVEAKEEGFVEGLSRTLALEEVTRSHFEQVVTFCRRFSQRAKYQPVRTFIETVWAHAFAKTWTTDTGGELKPEDDFMGGLSSAARVSLSQSQVLFDMMIWTTNLDQQTLSLSQDADEVDRVAQKVQDFIPKVSQLLRQIALSTRISAPEAQTLSF